jgi:phosphoribosyl 1,2-cyclic phosphodiesterase
VTLWGTRGSLASPGPDTARYGGNTSCVEVEGNEGTVLVLDAGTGLRRLTAALPQPLTRIDVLLTHLHLDHLQGLGFFAPLYEEGVEIHIWGPGGVTHKLGKRLTRYLSPPLFPVPLRSLPSKIQLHETGEGEREIGEFLVRSDYVCHPGPTIGYRIANGGAVMAYLPDHEPALGVQDFPNPPEWTSGYGLAEEADLLIHDAQYTEEQYPSHVGWGHSSVEDAIRFGRLARVRQLVLFHHDPQHTDDDLDRIGMEVREVVDGPEVIIVGREGDSYDLGS